MQTYYVLPLVDISKLHSCALSDRLEVPAALDQACKEVGFLYLTGKQFNFEYVQDLIEVTKAYFDQDLELKIQRYIGLS